MALHQLSKITIGVPNVDETIQYYSDFGLGHLGEGRFTTREGGEQLNIRQSRIRRLEEIWLGCDDRDDLLPGGRSSRSPSRRPSTTGQATSNGRTCAPTATSAKGGWSR